MIQTVDVFLERCGNKEKVGKLASENRRKKSKAGDKTEDKKLKNNCRMLIN